MSIRSDMITSKIAGTLQKTAIEKLSQHIKSFQDYCMFIDVMKDMEKSGATDPAALRNLLIASTMIGGAGIVGGKLLRTKQIHNEIKAKLLADQSYPDKDKVEKIYDMMAKFAPKSSSNYTFAKSVMDQLYNAPMISAQMVEQIVRVEQGLQGTTSLVPAAKDLLSAGTSVSKMAS